MTIVGKTQEQVMDAYKAAARVVEVLQMYAQGSAAGDPSPKAMLGRFTVAEVNLALEGARDKAGAIMGGLAEEE